MRFVLKAIVWLGVIFLLMPDAEVQPVKQAAMGYAQQQLAAAQELQAKAQPALALAEAAAALAPQNRELVSHTLLAQDLEIPFGGRAKPLSSMSSATSLAPLVAPLPRPRPS